MKRIVTLGVVFGFFLSSAALSAQTADELLAKMIEAQGGKKVLEGIKDMTVTGTLEVVPQGMEGSLTVYKKEPDKRRSDIEIMGMLITNCFDGKIAWGTNQQTFDVEEFTGPQADNIKREAMPIVAALYPEKYGISHALKGKESLEGKEYHVLERKYEDGFTATIYVDPETYLPYRTDVNTPDATGVEHAVEQYATDYKKVNGLMMSHSVTQFLDGMEYLVITISEVKFNTGIEDTLFQMEK
jgi:outer membrane lipoprotein-sorting protein